MNKERDNNWKNKAITRSNLLKICNKELVRQTARAKKWRKKSLGSCKEIASKNLIIKDLESKIKAISDDKTAVYPPSNGGVRGYKYSLSVIELCVKLYKAGLSTRCICGVLFLIGSFIGGLFKVPSHVTVSFWVQKTGLYLHETGVEKFKKSTEKWCLIIDESYSLAKSQLLIILAVRLSVLQSGRLKTSDVVPVLIRSQGSWVATDISDCISEVTKDFQGSIAYVTSDCGTALVAAYKNIGLNHVPDWSHYAANSLAHIYVQNADFKEFNEKMGAFKRKRKQSIYTQYAPPNLSVKIRFMNYLPILEWANIMLKNFSKIPEEIKTELHFLQVMNPFIIEVTDLFYAADAIGKIIKEGGINEKIAAKAQRELWILAKKHAHNQNVATFIKKIEQYFEHTLSIYKDYVKSQDKNSPFFDGLIASSDIIESLFGKLKHRASKNPSRGFSAICLIIPLFCQDFSSQEALKAMISVNMERLEIWKNKNLCNRKFKNYKTLFKKNNGKV